MLNIVTKMGTQASGNNIIEDKEHLIEEYKQIDRKLEKNDKTSYKVLISFFIAIVLFILFSIYSIIDIYNLDVLSTQSNPYLDVNPEIPLLLDVALYGSVFVLIVFIILALKDMQKRSVLVNRKIEILELLKDSPFFDEE